MIIPNLCSRLQFWSGHIYEMNAIAHIRSTSFSCAILMNRLICTVKFLRNWHVWDITFHFDSWVKSDNTMSLEVYMTDLALTDVSYMEFAGERLRLRIYCFYAKSYIFSEPSSTVFHKLVKYSFFVTVINFRLFTFKQMHSSFKSKHILLRLP